MISANEAKTISQRNNKNEQLYQEFMNQLDKDIREMAAKGHTQIFEMAIPYYVHGKTLVRKLHGYGFDCSIYTNSTQTELLTIRW